MESRTKLAEKRKLRKKEIIVCSLVATCILVMLFSSYQAILILDHCGRDFRLSHLSDPFYEQLTMTFLEVALSIAGLIGLWTKRGAVYFVAISFWICTVMIQHFADLLMGIIYLLSYGHGLDGVERFLRRNYENLKKANIFATAKIHRIQKCKQCCGINGFDEDYLRLANDTLIYSCCPADGHLPCTRERAYKSGCARKLLEDEHDIAVFHALSAIATTQACLFFHEISDSIKL